jgi:DNA-binding response OmpR family regulator
MRVLVVEDEALLARSLARGLRAEGIAVDLAHDGIAGRDAALRGHYDVVVLDIMLPGLQGYRVLQELRAADVTTPVLMLTAKDGEYDEADAFDLGADDYLTKPFSPRELVLRVTAVLRRAAPPPARGLLRDGDLVVDLAAREARRAGRPLALTVREFDLLAFFLHHPREAFDRTALLRQVWEWSFGDASTVTVHVRRLREKVEDHPSAPTRVVTVFGVGYRYEPQEHRS